MKTLHRLMRRSFPWVGSLALLIAVGMGAPDASAQLYDITDLGTLGGADSTAADVIDQGLNLVNVDASLVEVVGHSSAIGDEHIRAFRARLPAAAGTLSSVMEELGTLGGGESRAFGLNDFGDAVGFARLRGGEKHAVLFIRGETRDLGTLGGRESTAFAINGLRQVAGEAQTSRGDTHAFRWTDTMQDLGTLGGSVSRAFGINFTGVVVGEAANRTGQMRAFLWRSGAMRDLGTLGGPTSSARSINDADQVVGASATADGQIHAFRWRNGVLQNLGTLGGSASRANAINDAGQVVGKSTTAGGQDRAFLYTDATGMIDLNTRIHPAKRWVLREATSISERGAIVGWGLSEGAPHAFLLMPRSVGYRRVGPRARVALVSPSAQWFIGDSETAPATPDASSSTRRMSASYTAIRIRDLEPTDLPVPGDYWGSGTAQLALFRPRTGTWYLRAVESFGTYTQIQFGGGQNDIPVPADYLGVGRWQMAVFRPATAEWLIRNNDGAPTVVQFGATGDTPVPADYLGLGRVQIAVYRRSTGRWYIRRDDGSALEVEWGGPGDLPVPADFSGTGRADIAVFRGAGPAGAQAFWHIRSDSFSGPQPFGFNGDIPVPADYDGIGRSQLAVFRPSNGDWLIRTHRQNAQGRFTFFTTIPILLHAFLTPGSDRSQPYADYRPIPAAYFDRPGPLPDPQLPIQ